MIYKNARIFGRDFQFHTGCFEVTPDGRFGQIFCQSTADAVDLEGKTVIPGLVDIHTHGNSGADFSDGNLIGLQAMSRYLATQGITAFTPTSMTLPYKALEQAFYMARILADNPREDCARVMGIHMEGPYFSEKKKGAQNGSYLKTPDLEGFQKLQQGCGDLVRIVDIAPELPGAKDFIQSTCNCCTVSVAHTDADYDAARTAFASGASHLTHLFNAMPGIHHRNPGVIAAAAEAEHVRAELICDGLHVHPAAVRLAFRMFGPERIVLISDALRCCGMPDGQYELGGQTVYLQEGVARLADGTIAGSATNLYDCMRKAMEFDIPPEDAIRAATYNPACAIGAESKIGSIEPGKLADFIVCSGDYREKAVYINGKLIQGA